VEELKSTTAQKASFESELKIAHNIQMSMLPKTFPPYPERDDIDIFGTLMPAKAVGGDLFDFYIHNEQLIFCIGDVSGKGVPASLFMAQTMRLFRAFAKRGYQPSVIATRINEELTENNENGMFVTMFMGVLDLKTGHLDFCNAGHNPPILDQHFIDMEPNAPLGLWEGLEYEGESLDDISSKRLFIYSDGLNEAENHVQDQYSDDRLLTFLRTHADDDCRSLITHLQEDVEKHVNGADPSDDLTMLCLKYK
jgi:serine phosphatase RsbU (regulator of sigma subunit)